jgi:D-alanyl-D-alanine carboxypeptidase (penicillin-binding protein 5/6)
MSRRGTGWALAAGLVLGAVLPLCSGGAAAAQSPQSPEPKAWIVVDAGTGEVLAAHDEHTPRHPASLAKIMTALTAVERLPPDAQISVSARAAARPASRLGVVEGQDLSFSDALAALLLVSANDVATALAENAADGDLQQFADALNSTARRYGMKDSALGDPAGLDSPGEAFGTGPLMSAFDVAISVRNALSVPTLAALAASATYEYTNRNGVASRMTNHNKLLAAATGYEGANGFKTGFTSRAGHTLAATATRQGRTIITVILDTYDVYGWARHLLDVGFSTARGQGTGERLPPIEVAPYAQRATRLLEFSAFAVGSEQAGRILAASAPTTTTTTPSATTTASSAPATGVTAPSTAATLAAAGESGRASATPVGAARSRAAAANEGGGVSVRLVALALLVLLTAAFFVRRRQITIRKRRRARARAARLRMRRGTLPVADGRPPVQSRSGTPRLDATTDSHVRRIPIASRD